VSAVKGQAQDSIPKKKLEITKEFSGDIRGDYRVFPEDGLYPGQHNEYFSIAVNPKLYLEWDDGNKLIQFNGFARLDQHDKNRTHADIRELYWQSIFKNSELSIGVKKIFWGVTESNHLVDIINQSDVVEGFDIEQKLGQPMIHYSISPSWGTLDFFAMTYFRKMKFPGTEGRLRPSFQIDDSQTTYESEMEEYNPDLAVRWAHSIGVFDLGLSHFYGTSRLAFFQTTDGTTFTPHYELINQTGLDVQASVGSMLWKGEIIHRESKRKTVTAFTVGGEYTFGNLFSKGIDLGLIAEYNFDDRGLESINGLNNDMFYGLRFAFNDRQSTDILIGAIIDNDNQTLRYFAKANRRLSDTWKLSIEGSGYNNIDESEFIYLIRNDGFAQISISKYL
jgi:hypothetical protein